MEPRKEPDATTDLSEVERLKIERAYDRFRRFDYYEILNVPRTATRAQIKKNYHLVSKEYHPDRYFRKQLGPYKDKLEFVFDQISKAYSTLIDDAARAEYDRQLIEQSMAEGPPTYEVEMEVGRPAPEGSEGGGDSASGEVSEEEPKASEEKSEAEGEKRRSVGKSGKAPGRRRGEPTPLFIQQLKKRIMARMLKARAYLKAGREAFEKEQYGTAVAHLQLALAYEPKLSEARELLSVASERVNEVKAEAHYQRAQQELAIGNMENGRFYLKAAVECRPKKGHYYYKYAMFLMESPKDRREGIEQLKLAVEHEPKNVEYRLTLAKAFEEMDMPLNAKREYERVLAIDKSNQEAQKAARRLRAV